MQRPKTTLLILFSLILLTLQGCDPIGGIGDFFETLFSANVMIIRGIKTISGEGEVLTIQPGTTIKFKEETFRNIGGELLFKDGAKFVCQGTADEPIVFDTIGTVSGCITIDDTASNDSIIKYCTTDENNTPLEYFIIVIRNSATIEENKFKYLSIYFKGDNCSPLIQNNTFDVGVYGSTIFVNAGGGVGAIVSPIIKYNIITNSDKGGLTFENYDTPTVEYNNITNCERYAIFKNGDDGIIINNCYISDCEGKSGVDLTGEQSYNVVYSSPSDIPIQNAGCGW